MYYCFNEHSERLQNVYLVFETAHYNTEAFPTWVHQLAGLISAAPAFAGNGVFEEFDPNRGRSFEARWLCAKTRNQTWGNYRSDDGGSMVYRVSLLFTHNDESNDFDTGRNVAADYRQ